MRRAWAGFSKPEKLGFVLALSEPDPARGMLMSTLHHLSPSARLPLSNGPMTALLNIQGRAIHHR
jgi:hypothetical protein